MRKWLAGIGLCLVATAVRADDGLPFVTTGELLPLPRPNPGGTRFSDEDNPTPSPLVELKTQLLRLKEQREGLNGDRVQAVQYLQAPVSPDAEQNAKLRLRLNTLLTRLGMHKEGHPSPLPLLPPVPPPEPKKVEPPGPRVNGTDNHKPEHKEPTPPGQPPVQDSPPPDMAKAIDPLALAQALFRAGNYHGALQAYRLLPQEGLKSEERAPLQYMIATCLRQLGKTEEAAAIYREVANVRGDEVVAHCAQWQLNALRWHKEITDQLKDLRQRRQALETTP